MDRQKTLSYIDLGARHYNEVFSLQERLRQSRINDEIEDVMLFCEHYPVYTVGKQDCNEDWLSSFDKIKNDGIDIIYSNRGGRITYHGPGQLVVYFILRVGGFGVGVRDFVAKLEDACIDFTSGMGIAASRNNNYPGIWVGGNKIVAIGLHVSKGVSMHGIAINVDTDLTHYRHIIPCGIRGYGVTSLAKELAVKPCMDEVKNRLIVSVGKIFNCSVAYATEKVRSVESSLFSS